MPANALAYHRLNVIEKVKGSISLLPAWTFKPEISADGEFDSLCFSDYEEGLKSLFRLLQAEKKDVDHKLLIQITLKAPQGSHLFPSEI